MRTEPDCDTIILAKTIAALRKAQVYSEVCKNPLGSIQDLKSVVGSCSLESDINKIKFGAQINAK